MKIYVLCEDTALPSYSEEHGLSLLIETEKHRILFDAGQSDIFLKNAITLGIDIADVDIFILSHGHYDHGGGIQVFLEHNDRAKIYMHPKAFGAFYHGKHYIGLNQELQLDRERMVFVSDDTEIDPELTILTAVGSDATQSALTERFDGNDIADAFEHELYLEVSDASRKVIFTGCAHKGVVSIADMACKRGATDLVGGFHLTNDLEKEQLSVIAETLGQLPLVYHTGHCTSPQAFSTLKSILRNRLHSLQSGKRFVIGDHATVARFLFRCGYNCSQAVLGAFADELGIDFETAMRLSCSFGGGMGRMREVCGAVSGMLMVCGAKNGYSTPETGIVKGAHYRLVQELASEFRQRHGSIICRELLGGTASSTPTPTPRTEAFYQMRPCERLIASAAAIAEERLFNK